jgi:hypothetical protein
MNEIQLSEESLDGFKKKIKHLKLDKYYSKSEECTSSITRDEVIKLLKAPSFLKISTSTGNILYKTEDGTYALIPEDFSSSFVGTDPWVSSRIYSIKEIFPNSTFGNISIEMGNLYTCAVVAYTFGGAIEKRFLKVITLYDFKKFEGPLDAYGESENFTNLKDFFLKLNSKSIDMLVSACASKLKAEKKSVIQLQTSGLSQDQVLELGQLKNKIASIRFEYVQGVLSESSVQKNTRLETRNNRAEMESEIESAKNEMPTSKELLKLFNINRLNIDANSKLIINQAAEDQADYDFGKLGGLKQVDKNNLVYRRDYVAQLEREAIKAFANRFISKQKELFISDPASYVAPDFI